MTQIKYCRKHIDVADCEIEMEAHVERLEMRKEQRISAK